MTILTIPAAMPTPETAAARSVDFEATVRTSPAAIYEVWTTAAGAESIFPGAKVTIAPEVGGEYTVAFDPDNDPEGLLLGTSGCRILALEPGKRIVVEWNGPPNIEVMRARPYPTWIEIDLLPVEDGKATHVTLSHKGFQRGEQWDAGVEFFTAAWGRTMEILRQRYEP